MEFRILGPLEVVHAARSVALGGSRERALLALLLLSANQVVSSERLAEDLWAGQPPQGANQALRVYVSRLRKTLREAGGEELLCTQPPGYVARVSADDLDSARFKFLVARGRVQMGKGDHEGAAATLAEALSLWRGPALADLVDAPFARAEVARLEEARLAALEERIEADLVCGRHGELVAELDALTRTHPLRERFWAQRMVALYRQGRQADALRAYQDLRSLLGDELGLEPSTAVARLEGAILRHEPELDWPPADRAEPAPPGPAQPLEGVVTFLFTDLVGSTGWLERLGEDGAEELRRTHFSLLRDAVSDARGQEVKNLGDGLMVAFTSPLAALGCAVVIQRSVAEHNRAHPERRLAVRVGLQAGEATRAEDDFFGTAVVVAKRLCDQAEGGQILAGALLASLVGSRGEFRFQPLGLIALRGLAEPVPMVAVPWGRETGGAAEEGESRPSVIPLPRFLTGAGRIFVGREDELNRLRVAWKEVQAGRRRVVLVGGEPGVGKTRLAAVLAEELHADGATVLAGRCDEDLGVPYQPFVEALRHVVDHTPLANLPARLGRFGGELARLVPEVAEHAPGLPAPLRSDPETERYRLFDAVAAFLGAVAGDDAVLLVLDDLQWAAKPTLLLLRHVARSPACGRLLVLATYRDTELGDPLLELLADLRRDGTVERLALSGLEETDVLAVMERAAGHDLAEDGRVLVRAIHEETDGNPFFVWELVRHLVETGVVVRQQGRWIAQQPELRIPEGVHDVVRRRLTRLSDTANQVLNSAAVVGTDFDVGVLSGLCDLEEGELVVALDEAAAARLVEETGVDTYRFVHALVRSSLYQALSATRRARLHLLAADVFQDRDDVASLARHLLASAPLADPTRTAPACLAAGDRALSVLADTEAADWYSQGLTFTSEEDPHLRTDLMTGLGEAQRRTGDPASRQTLLGAARLALDYNDVGHLVRAVLANNRGFFSVTGHVDAERLELIDTALDLVGSAPSAERAELLALQAAELLYADDHAGRLRAADEAAAITARLDDVTVQARVGMRRLWACWVPDRVSALVKEGAQVVGFADATGDPQLRAFSRTMWGGLLLSAGELSEARRRAYEAMAIADESGQPGLRCLARLYCAGALDALGDHDKVKRLGQVALELGQEAAWPDVGMWCGAGAWLYRAFGGQPEVAAAGAAAVFPQFSALVVWQGAWATSLALAGRDEELAGFLANLPAVLPRVNVDLFWLVTYFYFAAAQGFGVEIPEAAAAIYEALLPYRSLHASYCFGYWGPIEMALAVVARVRGDIELALAHHEAAAVTIEACGAARARAFNGYQWVVTLLGRDAPTDRQRAAELRQQTLTWCRAQGYLTFERKLEELLI